MKPEKLLLFWHELTRRRVFRGIAMYGASTLVILESADIICSAIGVERIPVWLLWILGIGFLGSIWFSWIFDLTPGGIKKTESASKASLPFDNRELRTYKISTYFSIIIIVSLLSYNLIDGIKTRKIRAIEKSIAVLPFKGDISIEHKSMVYDYIGEQIVAGLSKIEKFKVSSWSQTENYNKEGKAYNKIGRELRASLLVDWKVMNPDGVKTLTLAIVNASDGKIFWMEDYHINGGWSEVSLIRPEFTKDIARRLKTILTQEEKTRINRTPKSAQASMLSWQGKRTAQSVMQLFEMGRRQTDLSAFDKAKEYYTRAIELDSTFAETYAERGKMISWGIYTGYYDKRYLDSCRADINRSFELSPDLTKAHIALGFYYYYGLKDYPNALKSFEKASKRDPEDSDVLFYMSLIHRRMGNWGEVRTLNEKVLTNKTVIALYLTNIGLSYDFLHEFEKAIECHDKAIQLQPKWEAPYNNKAGSTILLAGDIGSARKVQSKTKNLPESNFHFNIALLDIFEGNYESARYNIDIACPDNMDLDGDKLLAKARAYKLAGYKEGALQYYGMARDFFSNEIRYNPDDSKSHSKLGISYAGLGMEELAIENGELAVDLTSIEDDALLGPERLLDLARIYAITGKHDLCVKLICRLVSTNSMFSSHIVFLDPDFFGIRTNPTILDL